mgnify:CR=1 FL=1
MVGSGDVGRGRYVGKGVYVRGEREREREGGSGEREWRKGVEKGSGEREWREKRGRCDVGESEGRDMMMYMKGRHTKHVI